MIHPSGPSTIDCPLRKQGIAPDGLRPFENTQKYIAFLERTDRATWQRPAKAGLVLRAEQNDLLPYQVFLVFAKP